MSGLLGPSPISPFLTDFILKLCMISFYGRMNEMNANENLFVKTNNTNFKRYFLSLYFFTFFVIFFIITLVLIKIFRWNKKQNAQESVRNKKLAITQFKFFSQCDGFSYAATHIYSFCKIRTPLKRTLNVFYDLYVITFV